MLQYFSAAPSSRHNALADTSTHACAQIIQHAALPRLIGDKTALRRTALLERVQLELELQRGLRLLMLCLCMFAGTLSLYIQVVLQHFELSYLFFGGLRCRCA